MLYHILLECEVSFLALCQIMGKFEHGLSSLIGGAVRAPVHYSGPALVVRVRAARRTAREP